MVPRHADLRPVLLHNLPHTAHMEVDLKQTFSNGQLRTDPLLKLACGGNFVTGYVVNRGWSSDRRANNKTLVQPGECLHLPRRRIRGWKENNLGPLLFQPTPLRMPVDVKADLNADRPKIGLKDGLVDSAGQMDLSSSFSVGRILS